MNRTHGTGQCEPDCFGCKVLTVSFDPYAMPSRLNPHSAPKKPQNQWEKGIARDERGMPYLNARGGEMSVKEFGEKRHAIETEKRARRAGKPVA